MGRLSGKVILITGGSGGQGTAEAQLFSKEGATVVLTDVIDGPGKDAVGSIVKAGRPALFLRHDVADEAAWQSVLTDVKSAFGALHVLVNNAGTISRHGVASMSLEAWERTMAVNLTGAVIGMKHCAPLIRDSGGGSIINVSSTAGMQAHYDAAYTASKWGLRGVTKTAAIEFAPWGIRVNSIHPAQVVDTGFYRESKPGHVDAARATIPMQRQGTPRECAELVMFLASDESVFITGSEIAIDGGYTAGAAMWMRSKMREYIVAAGAQQAPGN